MFRHTLAHFCHISLPIIIAIGRERLMPVVAPVHKNAAYVTCNVMDRNVVVHKTLKPCTCEVPSFLRTAGATAGNRGHNKK